MIHIELMKMPPYLGGLALGAVTIHESQKSISNFAKAIIAHHSQDKEVSRRTSEYAWTGVKHLFSASLSALSLAFLFQWAKNNVEPPEKFYTMDFEECKYHMELFESSPIYLDIKDLHSAQIGGFYQFCSSFVLSYKAYQYFLDKEITEVNETQEWVEKISPYFKFLNWTNSSADSARKELSYHQQQCENKLNYLQKYFQEEKLYGIHFNKASLCDSWVGSLFDLCQDYLSAKEDRQLFPPKFDEIDKLAKQVKQFYVLKDCKETYANPESEDARIFDFDLQKEVCLKAPLNETVLCHETPQ